MAVPDAENETDSQITPDSVAKDKDGATTETATTETTLAPTSTTKPPGKRSTTTTATTKTSNADRLARFRALQVRAKTSTTANMKEATRESQRLATDSSRLSALSRRHANAVHKLLKAETEEAGEDFERKRAWDWTAEESAAWDARAAKKSRARDDVAFRDYHREAQKSYKRQVRNMGAPDAERYAARKLEVIEKAAAAGTLEIVELADGEMVAVDRDGTFFSSAESTAFATGSRPDKEAVDKLVNDMRKAEETALRKRRDRQAADGEDAGDVTYINEKNKQFNYKLNRFYNKYTAEIRESFERGTAI